jgi:hypothetical protein
MGHGEQPIRCSEKSERPPLWKGWLNEWAICARLVPPSGGFLLLFARQVRKEPRWAFYLHERGDY